MKLLNKAIRLSVSAVAVSICMPAFANCFGSANNYNCFDARTGNSYSVQKYGNSTQMQGYNSGTGSSWSQNSQTYGNTTNVYGTASNGSSWNQTITPNATYGTDSRGNSFYAPRR
jgi:hypothetical protein